MSNSVDTVLVRSSRVVTRWGTRFKEKYEIGVSPSKERRLIGARVTVINLDKVRKDKSSDEAEVVDKDIEVEKIPDEVIEDVVGPVDDFLKQLQNKIAKNVVKEMEDNE